MAKKLVAIVLAVMLCVTMTAVAFGTFAEEAKVNTYEIISGTATKADADMMKAQTTNTVSLAVVDSSTLTTGYTSSIPAKAYKADMVKSEGKSGMAVKANVATGDFRGYYANQNDLTLDMWVYVSSKESMNNLIFRLMPDGFQTYSNAIVSASNMECYPFQISLSNTGLITKDGWNHIQYQMVTSAANTWQGNWNQLGAYMRGGKLGGFALEDHSGAKNAYTVALADLKITTTKDVAEVVADDPVYIVTGEEGETMLVGDRESASYNGGTFGCYTHAPAVIAQKVLPTAVDVSKSADGTVTAWVYVDDTAKLSYIRLELSSSGKNDDSELEFNIAPANLQNGWNKVTLDLSGLSGKSLPARSGKIAALSQSGNANLTKINFIRVHAGKAGDVNPTLKVGQVYFNPAKVEPKQAEPEPEVKDTNAAGLTLISANVPKKGTDLGTVNSGNVSIVKTSTLTGGDAGVPSEDAYFISQAAKNQSILVPVLNTDWTVPSGKNLQGYGINAWIYISDASKMGQTFVMRFYEEGYRSGIDGWDFQITNQLDKTVSFKNGWNNVTFWFPATGDFDRRPNGIGINKTNGTDGKTITEMVIEDHNTANKYDIAIACARLVSSSKEAGAAWDGNAPEKDTKTYFIEAREGETVVEGKLDASMTDYYQNTNGAYTATAAGTAVVVRRSFDAIDISKSATATLWVYVEDASKVDTLHVELSSAGIHDKEEAEWFIKASDLKNGWNQLKLDLQNAKGAAATGTFAPERSEMNRSAINYTRVFFTGTNTEVAVGAFYVTPTGVDGGDSMNFVLVFAVLALACAAAATAVFCGKKAR